MTSSTNQDNLYMVVVQEEHLVVVDLDNHLDQLDHVVLAQAMMVLVVRAMVAVDYQLATKQTVNTTII